MARIFFDMTSYQSGFMKLTSWQMEVKEGNLMYKSKYFDKDSQKLYVVKNFLQFYGKIKIWQKCHVANIPKLNVLSNILFKMCF